MLFIGGLTHKEERLEMPQPLDCEACAQKGQYELWMSAWSLTLFFIPVLKWGRSYRLYSPCCRRWHCLERKVGQELAQGLKKSLDPQDLLVGEASNEQR